jgi:hypothetical protein
VVSCFAAVVLLAGMALVAGSKGKASGKQESPVIPNTAQPTSVSRLQRDAKGNYGSPGLAFEPNVGQTDSRVKYMAPGRAYSLFVTSNAVYFAIPILSQQSTAKQMAGLANALNLRTDPRARRGKGATRDKKFASIEMDILGSNPHAQIAAESKLPGVVNYILGRDPSRWRSGVPRYGQLRDHNVYPGVDVAYHSAAGDLQDDKFQFDFLINPGVNPAAVKLGFRGAKHLHTTVAGDLVIESEAGRLQLHRPFAYQEANGVRRPVDARFVTHAGHRVSFALGTYEHNRHLVIDPTVTYSTYLGGSAEDDGNAITVDSSGNAYITGETDSPDFPGAAGAPSGGRDVFVTELSPIGTLVFTTLVGGASDDIGNAIAVDTTGSPPGIYVTGQTASTDFPTTGGVVQPTFLGTSPTTHGFVFKLSANGSSMLWNTFIEGSDGESALGLALSRDAVNTTDDDVYVVGSTLSVDLGSNTQGSNGTVNPLPHGGSLNNGTGSTSGSDDGFIAKVGNGGTRYLFLSYLGGSSDDSAYGVALDSTGNAYVTGGTSSMDFYTTPGVLQPTCGTDGRCNVNGANTNPDGFVLAITSGDAPTYIYSTFLGGENKDEAFAIAVDSAKNAYVTGQTFSTQFPTKNPLTGLSSLAGTQDAFVASLNPTGTALNYSTYLGGSGTQAGLRIAIDSSANSYVTGYTTSTDFPTAAATQAAFGGGDSTSFNTDAFVSELNLNGTSLSLPFSTYLGGKGDEDFVSGALAVDGSDNIYVTGDTNSSNFPLTSPAYGTYNAGSTSATCMLAGGGSPVPCPDAFVTVFAPSSDFSIAGSPLAVVNAGSSSTSTITITSFHGYSNTVNLACSVSGGDTPAPTCSFTSTSVSGGSGTSTLTVQTTAPTAGTPARRLHASLSSVWLPVGIVLIGGGLLGGGARRKSLLGLILIASLLSGLIFLPSCGGSSSSGGGGTTCSALPAAPSGLAASGTTTTGTSLSWTASSAPSGCTISGYSVYENGSTTPLATPTTASYTVTGLAPSTQYAFTIAATASDGTSPQSSPVDVTTGAPGTPSGTYTITVTGTDGTITHSIAPALTLTVN